ncbi:MAG TPA: hypothetical protein EYG42_06295 [Porticoccaceae bacterium]|nr:hypothetical protein [Porticoccaceae bacterium]
MTEKIYDVVIVGNGITSNAALIAFGEMQSKLDIAVLSPTQNRKEFGIGEHLSAAAKPILKDLGLWESFVREEQLEIQCAYSAWGSGLISERNSLTDPRGGGWSLDRNRFNRWLSDEAKLRFASTRIEDGLSSALIDESNGVSLTLQSGKSIRTRFVLDASGRSAVIAKQQTVRERKDNLIAVYNHFEQIDSEVEPTVGPLIEAMPSGWFYSALLPKRGLIVAWFTDADLLEKGSSDSLAESKRLSMWNKQIRASTYTLKRIESAGYSLDSPAMPKPAVADASTRLNQDVIGTHWAAAGDAAAAFDPLSSHGLTTALWAGKEAARGISARAEGNSEILAAYQKSYLQGISDYIDQAYRQYGSEMRFAETFWSRRRRPTVES